MEPAGSAGRDISGGEGLASSQALPQQAAWLSWLNPLVSGNPAEEPKAAAALPEQAGVSLAASAWVLCLVLLLSTGQVTCVLLSMLF